MVGSVMEEDCDGLCWHYILSEDVLKPEVVVSTEPSNLTLTRGQRGRMEIRVTARGVSCHGSAPERGDNAATKLAPACGVVDALNRRLAEDDFLGKGTCCVTWFGTEGPSLCAVPDKAELHIDRRLTAGETRESAVAEVETALAEAGIEAEVWVMSYEAPSWTGLVYSMEKYYPTWTVPEEHAAVRAGVAAHLAALGAEPTVSRWTFSTNGVAIKGLHDVPCVGFGPGEERLAHARDEYVPVDDVVKACAFYAAFPAAYLHTEPR
jgi:putative selenium metabolism hydrolase